jgi:hypothetical protein
MARKKSKTSKMNRETYEKALLEYFHASKAYSDDQNPKTRRVWQESVLKTLKTYSSAISIMQWTQNIPLDWRLLLELNDAMQAVIDGKDPELFYVDPSDSYDSHLRFAKEVAVAFVKFADGEAARQERKKWVMENYGVSRSTLNEWVRFIKPANISDNDFGPEGDFLHSKTADHYRECKLKGRRRKLIS